MEFWKDYCGLKLLLQFIFLLFWMEFWLATVWLVGEFVDEGDGGWDGMGEDSRDFLIMGFVDLREIEWAWIY